jgi:F-type H+-transporting ATPase subunit delta
MNDLSNLVCAYGNALFSLCEEISVTDSVLSDIDVLSELISQNPEYLKMLDSPAISKSERLELLSNTLATLEKPLVNMLSLLVEKRLVHVLPKIIAHFKREYELSRGIERVEVISAVLLTEKQLSRLKKKLEEITKKQIIISNTHDPSSLGGMKLRYMGRELDGTVKSKLDSFERRLSELVI